MRLEPNNFNIISNGCHQLDLEYLTIVIEGYNQRNQNQIINYLIYFAFYSII